MLRRTLLAAAPALLAVPALAQDPFPSRPIRMIIPVGVGGVTDVTGRVMSEALSAALGQPVVPGNVPGAGSTIGAGAFHRAAADGDTIFIGTNNHPVMKSLRPDFPHDPVTDFVPFALVGRQPFVLAVHPSVPARDVAQLMTWLRQRGDAANFGSANPGATQHLAGELLKQMTGVDYTIAPYRTGSVAARSPMDAAWPRPTRPISASSMPRATRSPPSSRSTPPSDQA